MCGGFSNGVLWEGFVANPVFHLHHVTQRKTRIPVGQHEITVPLPLDFEAGGRNCVKLQVTGTCT